MTGHLDDAEVDQLSPIYSFSLGLDCIFLIGGRTKEQKPIAVRLKSGDLLSTFYLMQSWDCKPASATTASLASFPKHSNPNPKKYKSSQTGQTTTKTS